jgi:hypothetical protein
MVRNILLSMVTLVSLSAIGNPSHPVKDVPKYLTVIVNPDGNVNIGRDTIYVDKLGAEIQQRLWKSWLGTGKMYDGIKVTLNGEVLMGIRGAALDAIQDGQHKALAELCIEKYKKDYDQLSASQQQKLRRNFPVLFQELHW